MEKEVISLLINGSISTIIGVAVVVVCYKSVKLFFDNQLESKKTDFQKDIEHYKHELEKEKNAFMIRIEQDKQKFQSELDRQLTEHSVLFNALNVERFKITNKIFGLLLKYYDSCKSYTDGGYLDWDFNNVYGLSNQQKFDEGFEILERVRLELWSIFAPNRLYFSDTLSKRISKFIDLLNTEVDLYRLNGGFEKREEVSQNHLKIREAITDLHYIEDEFRTLLSVR